MKVKNNNMFSAANRANILKLIVGKPSGVIASVGGMEFDLLPLSTSEAMGVFELINKISGLIGKGAESADPAVIAKLVGEDGGKVVSLARSVLCRAARFANSAEFEETIFDEWFDAQELKTYMGHLLPKIAEANGLGGFIGSAGADPLVPMPLKM